MASDLFLENKEMLGVEGIKGNIYRRPISSVYQKKQKYILLYTQTTTLTHNHSNPFSPTARYVFTLLRLSPKIKKSPPHICKVGSLRLTMANRGYFSFLTPLNGVPSFLPSIKRPVAVSLFVYTPVLVFRT